MTTHAWLFLDLGVRGLGRQTNGLRPDRRQMGAFAFPKGLASTMGRAALDLVAVLAAVIALIMAVVYVGIMRQQADSPEAWFLVALIGGAVAAGYGAYRAAPYRGVALVLGGLVLAAIGVLGILSIGLPVLVAGALCIFAAGRSARPGLFGFAPRVP